MSNLSELLPAGGGGKNVNFVASGTLGNGVTVALNSDGTVSVIPTASQGSEAIFDSLFVNNITTVYDSNTQKIILTYRQQDTNGYARSIVGTISGDSISFGTPVVAVSQNVLSLVSTYHSSEQKLVLAWYTNGPFQGSTVAGSISGTSLTFGSAQVFESNQIQNWVAVGYDSSATSILYAYVDDGGYKAATVATLSGTTFSFGSKARIDQNGLGNPNLVQDQATGKLVVVYNDNSSRGKASIVTISGTTPSFGTEYQFSSSAGFSKKAVYDSSSNKIVIAYRGASNYGQAVVATVSGSAITYGTVYTFNSSITNIAGLAFDSGSNKVTVVVSDQGDSNYGKYAIVEVSGTSVSFGSLVTYTTGNGGISTIGYDSNAGKNLISFSNYNNSNYGTSFVLSTSNSSSFIGITDSAISDTASGSVTIKGGISTNVTGLTANATYYVQDNGTLSTTTSSVLAGKALSATSINLDYTT